MTVPSPLDLDLFMKSIMYQPFTPHPAASQELCAGGSSGHQCKHFIEECPFPMVRRRQRLGAGPEPIGEVTVAPWGSRLEVPDLSPRGELRWRVISLLQCSHFSDFILKTRISQGRPEAWEVAHFRLSGYFGMDYTIIINSSRTLYCMEMERVVSKGTQYTFLL